MSSSRSALDAINIGVEDHESLNLRRTILRDTGSRSTQKKLDARALQIVASWYFANIFGVCEGPGTLPFYCDPNRVGSFATKPDDLAAGDERAFFRVFVTLSMYQALRDVVIMRQQCSLPRHAAHGVADIDVLKHSIVKHKCSKFLSSDAFDEGCDVFKSGKMVDCGLSPSARCHVKDATLTFNRMGDMGKLPTSAWLRLWKDGGLRRVLADVCREEISPMARATLLVQKFAQVHRVGRKLATLFVSALSTPALAPGLTPLFPEIDGNMLVVVDTNVARAVDALREPGAQRTYDARERWVREQAAHLDLRVFRQDAPAYSPRLVQQALYAFSSKSNRAARGDACATGVTPCLHCTPMLCPFIAPTPKASSSSI